ncbi:FAD-dependent pyridine nucleotide-disulphide oxidoreductase [Kineococcus radiotolerans SRS30216 = ATCC BAA-149]|uniref:FAD-dependent pyridine nucleotide-disulphide oxidoreductase n=1 Tax=Kineococcus radiotolerans (strain ATCC BAA-149 / DSM 14245 / SRS30216) TaxID=266940 RepID=A6WB08_KINRD|nr:FAD-dependent pyridine nucleotide-disulphide oxidoreductase [Kineococcus radiotolerans SRS30216 = ATCC BAA-149]
MTSPGQDGVVIVGAGAAGLATVEGLRAHGYNGAVRLIGDEAHLPYDRPPLSKDLLTGPPELSQLHLSTPQRLSQLQVQVLRGAAAERLSIPQRTVHLDDGRALTYEHLVLATGVRPRPVPGITALRGVHHLRTVDEAGALHADLQAGRRLVVLGGGLVGAEVAAVAAILGLSVTVLCRAQHLLAGAGVGADLDAHLLDLHQQHGVHVRTGPDAQAIGLTEEHGRVTGVRTADGTVTPADVLLVAGGSAPAVGWLAGSGLDVSDGVLSDVCLRAGEDVYAVGDVCRWPHPRTGQLERVEHRSNATEQGLHVGQQIATGVACPFDAVPYFWSRQFGMTLHAYGWLRRHDHVRLAEGSFAEGKFVLTYHHGDQLVGVVGARSARSLRDLRKVLETTGDLSATASVPGRSDELDVSRR